MEYVSLLNGVKMPLLGLGTWLSQGEETVWAIQKAVSYGYRSFDTAALYGNEESIGRGIRECGIPREKLFITSKIWNEGQDKRAAKEQFLKSLRALALDYLDLYLIHWPRTGDYTRIWEAMQELRDHGLIRAIGVSNFGIPHLQELIRTGGEVPAVNQFEFHPGLGQKPLRAFCREKGIQGEACIPLMRGEFKKWSILDEIAGKYGRTTAQIILRWDIQNGMVTIPKTVIETEMKENLEIFDFVLSKEEMLAIDSLESGLRLDHDPDMLTSEYIREKL